MLTFHEERLTGIGGSDAPLICGKSSFGGPADVYMQKLELEPPLESNERMEAGTRFEPAITEWWSDYRGIKVVKPEEMLRHPKYPHMICHVDGLLYNGSEAPIGLLEVKNVGVNKAKEWGDEGDQIPQHVIIQCMHNLFVASGHFGIDFQSCEVAAMIGGNEPRFNLSVLRDEKLIEALVAIEGDFWEQNVKAGVPPTVDGSEGSARLIRALYPDSNELVMEADDVLNVAAILFMGLRDQIGELTERQNEHKNTMMLAMKESGALMTDVGKFTYKKSKDGQKTDWKGICKELTVSQEIIDAFSEFKPGTRSLRPPRSKKEK